MKELEKVEKLLIVVDMVNGFVREGNMADPYIGNIIPAQVELITSFIKQHQQIAFIKDNHLIGCEEFKRYPVHCVIGTSEANLVNELLPYEKDALVYQKNSTSTIFAPGFLNDIEKMVNLKEVVIVGCCTDICVINLALPLRNYFDQMNRDVKITMPTNMVETYNSSTHNREEYNDMSFKLMEQGGIQLVKKYK